MKPMLARAAGVLLFVLMAILSIAVSARGRTLQQELFVAREDLVAARESLSGVRHQQKLRDEIAFAEFQDTYAIVRLEIHHRNKPAERLRLKPLLDAGDYFREYLQRTEGDDSAILRRTQACINLARVHLVTQELGAAEQFFRSARQLLDAHRSQISDYEYTGHGAIIDSRLGYILAKTSRFEEARSATKSAIESFKLLQNSSHFDADQQFESAVAYRNLGLITEALGESGESEFHASRTTYRNLVSLRPARLPSNDLLPPGKFHSQRLFHADTCQILMAILWREGQFIEAETVCLDSLKTINAVLTTIEMTNSPEPTQRFREATKLAKANLDQLRVDLARSQLLATDNTKRPTSRLPAGWQWKQLNDLDGQSIRFDLLATTKLHGEFETHDAMLISWLDGEWFQETILQIVAAAAESIPIIVIVKDEHLEESARESFEESGIPQERVRFLHIPVNSTWVRDFGPLAVNDAFGHARLIDSVFRPALQPHDDLVPRSVSRILDVASMPVPLSLEGGALLCNGAGVCLVSRAVLDWNLQHGYDERHVTHTLKRVTGSDQVVYLDPIKGEPNFHIDTFATFTAPDSLVLGRFGDSDPENDEILDRHAELLSGLQTDAGPLKVTRIPMPAMGDAYFGGSYTNVVYANGVLIVPTWSDTSREAEALDVYRRLLPDWTIKSVDCRPFESRIGGPHCATLNLYRVPRQRQMSRPVSGPPSKHSFQPASVTSDN